MDPGFKPVSYHLPSKGKIPVANLSMSVRTESYVHTGTRTKQPSLTYHTEHSPSKRPVAEISTSFVSNISWFRVPE
ncbi:hypothetical protein DPMN_095308 [Dreissena polymorpha]|uniref:Uncharacterized protein n=1 Tax=Dreissena polymorpha TaxID=45954 RepID=A0A9D4L6M5_DREPO|nr:hypothetical protein DPMN_095308 [Dreissena polymorpha]